MGASIYDIKACAIYDRLEDNYIAFFAGLDNELMTMHPELYRLQNLRFKSYEEATIHAKKVKKQILEKIKVENAGKEKRGNFDDSQTSSGIFGLV